MRWRRCVTGTGIRSASLSTVTSSLASHTASTSALRRAGYRQITAAIWSRSGSDKPRSRSSSTMTDDTPDPLNRLSTDACSLLRVVAAGRYAPVSHPKARSYAPPRPPLLKAALMALARPASAQAAADTLARLGRDRA